MNSSTSRITTEQRDLLVALHDTARRMTDTIMGLLRDNPYVQYPVPAATGVTDPLHRDIGDIIAISDRLIELRLLDASDIASAAETKLARLENYQIGIRDIDFVIS